MLPYTLIPSIDALLLRPALAEAAAQHGRSRVRDAARRASDALRAEWRDRDETAQIAVVEGAVGSALEARILTELSANTTLSLRRVINATGVILHTNLGRAPLPPRAVARAAELADSYSNLEYDLGAGHRGRRDVHAESLLCHLTGAEAGVVVNNNAAATLLVLATLASGREVLVSRGELVEIGGGFRVPEVMAQSGAILREVGTTNRTRTSDYAAAAGPQTALVLRVHPSNFRVEGFTERPGLADLTAVTHGLTLPLFEDLGSGWLGLEDIETPRALADEPSVTSSLRAGADLVAFSGDKLLGGPQAGIIVGRRHLVDRVRRHPMMRALRADKMTYALLEGTLALWANPADRADIPAYRMLTMSLPELETRATALAEAIRHMPGMRCEVIDGHSTVGGGSAPASLLPTRLVAITSSGESIGRLEAALRAGATPVVARVDQDRLVLDPRTMPAADLESVVAALNAVARPAR